VSTYSLPTATLAHAPLTASGRWRRLFLGNVTANKPKKTGWPSRIDCHMCRTKHHFPSETRRKSGCGLYVFKKRRKSNAHTDQARPTFPTSERGDKRSQRMAAPFGATPAHVPVFVLGCASGKFDGLAISSWEHDGDSSTQAPWPHSPRIDEDDGPEEELKAVSDLSAEALPKCSGVGDRVWPCEGAR
jgi:hypothetical protein